LDGLDFLPASLKRSYVGSYLFMIRRMPWLWKCVYESSDFLVRFSLFRWIRSKFNVVVASRLTDKILREGPAAVFCTHFMPTEIMARMNREGPGIPIVAVVTDFMVHRLWVSRDVGAYAVALPETKRALEGMGISPERVTVTGIPVEGKFRAPLDRLEMRRRYRLNADDPVVLFTSGGAGAVLSEEDISRLLDANANMQILVVCGHNQALHESMAALSRRYSQIRPFEFVDTMHELMEVADVVVGKAGGLTVSEALVKRRCFIVMDPVPGQEVHNAEYLEESGAGLWVRHGRDLVATIENVVNNQDAREKILITVDKVRRPEAASDIVRLGIALIGDGFGARGPVQTPEDPEDK